jgi:hypothetical protein
LAVASESPRRWRATIIAVVADPVSRTSGWLSTETNARSPLTSAFIRRAPSTT